MEDHCVACGEVIPEGRQVCPMADSSGVFSEIGKSCRGSAGIVAKGKTESRVESIAKGYIEKDPSLSYTDAVAKAWENNPDLLASYDDEAGF